jgi:protease-4
MANPFMIFAKLMQKPDHAAKEPAIAVLHIGAEIVDGDSGGGGLFGGGKSVGSRTIRNAIEEILDDPMVKGVIVRIDSPGGSAIASEVIWQGLKRLSEKKPVWGSVGSMAASGGYYIASGTSKLYVNPSSIVGSIGVVGGRLSMAGLYEKLHVNVKSRSRGPMAGMFRSTAPWSPEELATVRQKMTETYNLFTSRVTAGRPGIDLSKTAEGRLFTGDKAIGLKMADQIGGLEVAIKDLASKVGLDNPEVVHYPAPRGLGEMLEETFGSAASPDVSGKIGVQAAEAIVREIVGERNWPQVRSAMNGLLQLRKEPVVLMNPSVLVVE